MKRRLWTALTIIPLIGGVAVATANATEQTACAATLPGIEQASEHMQQWQDEWGKPGAAGKVDLSATFSGAELIAMEDVTKAHEAFVAALDEYASRIGVARATIAACAS